MAGVQIYMANNINQLIDVMELKPTSIFQKSSFVTQTTGINHYLSLQLAKKNHVFANFQFVSPNQLIMDVARLLGNPNSSEYSTENLRWRIFKLLNSDDFKSRFPFVSNYYHGEELKRIQLATKLADLFDQYIVYRTDMMIDWQENPSFDIKGIENREEWQKWLWLEVKNQIGDRYVDKAQFQRHLLSELNSGKTFPEIEKLFSDIHIFGLTVLTKFHMEVLWSLKQVINVNFYFLNPCIYDFWYDSMSPKELVGKWSWHKNRKELEEYSAGNELLTSWGKVGQELFTQLFRMDDEVFSCLEILESETNSETLLQKIQTDIQTNARPNEADKIRFLEQDLDDGTIQIKSNYTEAREVEVLYDYLLDLIDNKYQGKLKPDEVVIMMPDVEKYVPFIKAVFDHGPKKIPYSIGDRPANSEQSLLTVCLQVLETYADALTSESVLQLLEFELIRDKYKIEDVDFIRDCIRDTNVRFGIEGQKDLETHLIAWEQGLKKLVMGVFMRDQAFDFDGESYQPYLNAEGQSVHQIMNFVSFVRDLIFRTKIVRHARELKDWNRYFLDLVDALTQDVSDREEEVFAIRKRLENLDFINQKLEGVELDFETYIYILQSYHKNESINDGYFRGRLTFCQALPMRSIPFKVVAFLGLNAKDFPRTDPEYAFDLIKMGRDDEHSKPQIGDRNTKDNDKYLFLEAILSAEDSVYLSYLGKSIKNNKIKTPSVLVDELIDYIDKYAELDTDAVRQKLIVEHPLRRISSDYLKGEKQLFAYKYNKSDIVFRKNIHAEKEEAAEKLDVVLLDDFIKYFKDPVTYYFQRVLGVYYTKNELLLSEEELFEVGKGLPEYKLKDLLLKDEPEDVQALIHQAKKDGLLPLKNVANVEFERINEPLEEVKRLKKELTQEIEEKSIEIDLELEGVKIKGSIEGVYDDNLVIVHVSSLKRLVKTSYTAYLTWLVARASGYELNLSVLCVEDGSIQLNASDISVPEAKNKLSELMDFYMENITKLVPFVPIVSMLGKRGGFSKNNLDHESSYNDYLSKSIEFGIWEDEEEIIKVSKALFGGYLELIKEK